MPLLVACRTSMTNGNASDAPASTSVPRRPRKKPSNVIMPTKARKLRTLGVDSRSNVGRIGPSSISLVRAAPPGLVGAGAAGTIIDKGGGEIVALRSFILCHSLKAEDVEMLFLGQSRAERAISSRGLDRMGRDPGG